MVVHPPISRSRPFTTAIRELAARTDAAVLLDLEGTILFANEAWERFARLGGGTVEAAVGARLLDVVRGEEPRDALRALLAWAARAPAGCTRSLTLECNGPDLARLVSMQVSPVRAGAEPIGLTIVQRVVRELPAGEVYEAVEGSAAGYRSEDGALEQCSCCRRTRRPTAPDEWDFVPGLVAAPPADAVFVYCPLCRELHDPLGVEEQG